MQEGKQNKAGERTQYKAQVQLNSPGLLLGATKVATSSWFDDRELALVWMRGCIENNLNRAGRRDDNISGRIRERSI